MPEYIRLKDAAKELGMSVRSLKQVLEVAGIVSQRQGMHRVVSTSAVERLRKIRAFTTRN